MAGYTRQSAASIISGNEITAAPLNNEFNALQNAFHATAGHAHDGTTGNAPKIELTTSVSGVLPVVNGGFGAIHKLDATTSPTPSDDTNAGYGIGSIWVDTTNDVAYLCVDATASAAVWIRHQVYDADLSTIGGLAKTDGNFIVADGTNWTVESGATARASLGLTIGTHVQAFDTTLSGLAALDANPGVVVQLSTDVFGKRTLTGTANQITVTNGNGVSGDPTFSLPNNVTINSTLSITNTTGAGFLTISSAATQYAGIALSRTGTQRWNISMNNDAESGSDAGSNLVIASYTDGGVFKANALTLNRATGDVTLAGKISAEGFTGAGASMLSGLRNKIINGDFDIWQRGTSFTALGYHADRWTLGYGGGTPTYTVSRQAFTPGQTDVPGNPKYFYRLAVSNISTVTQIGPIQRLEGVHTLAGKTVTVTFYAKADAAASLGTIRLDQKFGTGGSPSPDTNHAVTMNSQSLTTSWQKFTGTVTLSSISGKTLGTDGNDYLSLQIRTPLANRIIDIARVSIVEGDATSEADPFSPRHIQQELAMCQRYYYKTWDEVLGKFEGAGLICFIGMSATQAYGNMRFPVNMRAVPTLSFWNTTDDIAGVRWNGVNLSPSSVPTTNTGFGVINVASGGAADSGCFFQLEADAEL